MSDFLMRAVAAGIGVALAAGPLGCFVVWRRMAYFGDTLAHAGLTGVALGLLFGVTPAVGMIGTSVAIALALFLMERGHRVASDTLLGILSHAALAVGLILFAFLDRVRVDLLGYLFGDILAVTSQDLTMILAGATVVLLGLAAIWKPMVVLTIHADMAEAEGLRVGAVRLVFTLLVALTVAAAMKIVGILLVTAMLIIPAAAMRPLSRTPEAMALGAATIGALAVVGGMAGALRWDLPAGPAMVATAVALYLATALAGSSVRRLLDGRRR